MFGIQQKPMPGLQKIQKYPSFCHLCWSTFMQLSLTSLHRSISGGAEVNSTKKLRSTPSNLEVFRKIPFFMEQFRSNEISMSDPIAFSLDPKVLKLATSEPE